MSSMIIVKQDNIEVLRFEPIELRRVYDLPKFCALDNNKTALSSNSLLKLENQIKQAAIQYTNSQTVLDD